MPEFKSEITERFFGAGLTGPEYITRDEAKQYLAEVANLAQQDTVMKMVVLRFISSNQGWARASMERYIDALENDIKLVKLRLTETADKKDVTPEEISAANFVSDFNKVGGEIRVTVTDADSGLPVEDLLTNKKE